MLKDKGYAMPSEEAFGKAYDVYKRLSERSQIKNHKLVLADFSMSSASKRLWVFDMVNNTLLYHTWVAHGKNSGEKMATSFSNQPGSNKTSLGAYITAETYSGKHGYSLRLDGINGKWNDNARERAIVMHGAWYVSEDFIRKYARLGRSFGCPAVSKSLSKEIIDHIKNGACLYHYHPSLFE